VGDELMLHRPPLSFVPPVLSSYVFHPFVLPSFPPFVRSPFRPSSKV
jgi:hypothetical protein